MNAIKRHPLFAAWIALCVIFLVGGLGWTHHWQKRARQELNSVAQKTGQRDQLLQQARLADSDPEDEPPAPRSDATAPSVIEVGPRNPLDAFIEIARANAALRQRAASHGVRLQPDESFGFASFAWEGPPENQLVSVHRQLDLVALVVGKLFAARPDKLLAVQRERPGSAGLEGSQAAVADFFLPDPRLELRVPGLIDARSVRLEFTGQTGVLRTFLNSLATTPEQLLARSVEVEPLGAGVKFAVVVEWVEADPSSETTAMVAHDPATAVRWTEARLDEELFDSPQGNRRPTIVAVQSGSKDGWELVAVKRAPFRLQLVGYFGAPGNYTGTFASPGTPAILRARAGERIDVLGLTVRKVGFEKSAGPSGDEVTPSAVVWDERSQETVTLVGGQRRLTDTPVAILRLAPPPTKPCEYRIGDTFHDGTALCSIDLIQLDPAEVVITRRAAGQSAPERQVLRLGALQNNSHRDEPLAVQRRE